MDRRSGGRAGLGLRGEVEKAEGEDDVLGFGGGSSDHMICSHSISLPARGQGESRELAMTQRLLLSSDCNAQPTWNVQPVGYGALRQKQPVPS